MRQSLVIMVKEPRPGRVKTRLAADIGRIAAAWWVRHQVRGLLRRLTDPRWTLVLAVAPDQACASRALPAGARRIPQGRGDLGARMARAMRTMPPGRVCVIGGDIPGISRAHVARAFAKLGAADAVFGPAEDGGYWLVGVRHARRVPARIFEDVRWSSPHALADSVATLGRARIAFCDTLRDVDSVEDLAALAR